MVRIEDEFPELAVVYQVVGAGSPTAGSHIGTTAGPSTPKRPSYLQVLLTGLVLANAAASKGSAVYHSTQSTFIDRHVLSCVEEVEEEPEVEGPVAADILPVPAAAPGHIALPVPVVAAHADEAEHVYHDEDTVNENGVPWLSIAGSGHKVRKWYNARKGGTVMTSKGLGHFEYGTYGPNGLEF